MLTYEQTKTAYELLEQADAAFDSGDEILGSQKLWDAFADTMNAIARVRGLPPCRDDDDFRRLLHELATPERDYYSLIPGFSLARRFRKAAENGGPEDYEVEFFRPEVPRVIKEFAAMA